MAPAADAPQRPAHALRGDPPLTGGGPQPFQIDPGRLYEVGAGGTARRAAESPEARARRLSRLRWLLAIGLALNLLTWSAAGAALLLGGPGWGAAFGLVALLTAPLLALPALIEALARRRLRRRTRYRPGDFPGPG